MAVRTVCKVGINDVSMVYDENRKLKKWYDTWKNMLKRCYDKGTHERYPTYKGCNMCEEWKISSNFKKWFDCNYTEGYCLDKDILIDGNKVYSSETCRFIPISLNNIFLDSGKSRGEYPIGVTYHKQKRKFISCININGKYKHLGYFPSSEQAHLVYLKAKKEYCKEVADKLLVEGKITEEIRDAVYIKADNLK